MPISDISIAFVSISSLTFPFPSLKKTFTITGFLLEGFTLKNRLQNLSTG